MTTSDDGSMARMRWSGQRTDEVDEGTPPDLARLAGFVRSVRTSRFRGVTFQEVLAKTALNYMPADARMLPGAFTVNRPNLVLE